MSFYKDQKNEPRQWIYREKTKLDSQNIPINQNTNVLSMSKQMGLSPLTIQTCLSRGLKTEDEILKFLNPKLDQLPSPFVIKDMDRAVDRLAEARKHSEKIMIFGDYDVDGTTGAALLSWMFREFGFIYFVRQPDRFKDGYGLNVNAVEEASKEDAKILLTVDCGITSFEAAHRAKELGIDLIIVDHHQVDPVKGLPLSYAVINPQREDCSSGLKQLCGCGLAFFLGMALRNRGRSENWFQGKLEPNLKQHLDLVVIATAADMVPLTGVNRILVKNGMEALRYTRKPGLRALMEKAGIADRMVSPGHLGFVLGPRINASGRLKSASLAYDLLVSTDPVDSSQKAEEIEKINRERSEIQNTIWDQVRLRVETEMEQGLHQNAVVVWDKNWHEGVVGIVATRVVEKFQKPAVVISVREDFSKGSVRAYSDLDALDALRSCKSDLLGFGGHKAAAGLSLDSSSLIQFRKNFDQAVFKQKMEKTKNDVKSLKNEGFFLPLHIEDDCEMSDLNIQTISELEALGPFGPGNPEPVFAFHGMIKSQKILKERHLKLKLGSGKNNPLSMIEAIWFHAAENEELLNKIAGASSLKWAGVPELNRFRGNVTPTFQIKDLHFS